MRSFVACVMVAAGAAQGSIVNGGFEQPGQGFRSVGNGQTYGSWTCIGPSDIEFVHATPTPSLPGLEFSAYEGSYWIDLCGVGSPSAIRQTVSGLSPGQAYRVEFAFAANLWGPNFNFQMRVEWNGVGVGTFSRVAGGSDGRFMNWELKFVDVVATGSDQLVFRALTATSARGPAIDAVTIAPVPAPGAGAVLGLAVLAAGRRRRTTVGA
jgi:MYXO-CTERM domain-containing protein